MEKECIISWSGGRSKDFGGGGWFKKGKKRSPELQSVSVSWSPCRCTPMPDDDDDDGGGAKKIIWKLPILKHFGEEAYTQHHPCYWPENHQLRKLCKQPYFHLDSITFLGLPIRYFFFILLASKSIVSSHYLEATTDCIINIVSASPFTVTTFKLTSFHFIDAFQLFNRLLLVLWYPIYFTFLLWFVEITS